MGLYQVDPITGEQFELTPGTRAVNIVGGGVQFALTVTGITAAGRVVKQEFTFFRQNFPGGGGGLTLSTPGVGGLAAPTHTLGATATGSTGGAIAGTLGVARPVVVYMTSEGSSDGPKWTPPSVRKAVNSDIVHASERAVERGVFPDTKSAADALRNLGKKFRTEGLPSGTIPDPKRPDSVLVPIGDGYAVFEITKKGTAILRTVLGGS